MRLMRAKLLMGERSAKIENMVTHRLKTTIAGISSVNVEEERQSIKRKLARKEFGEALSANTAFRKLIDRNADGTEFKKLIGEGFTYSTSGVMAFTEVHARWLFHGGKGNAYTIRDIPSSEDMYLTEEVSSDKTLKVSGIILRPSYNDWQKQEVVTRSIHGLWQVTDDLLQWCTQKVDQLKKLKKDFGRDLYYGDVLATMTSDRSFISDDTYIIGKLGDDTANEKSTQTCIIVTSDEKLCRQASISTSNFVVRIEPIQLILALGLRIVDGTTQFTLESIRHLFDVNFFSSKQIPEPTHIYVDTGSMEAASLRLTKEVDPAVDSAQRTRYYYRDLLQYGITPDNKRYSTVHRILIDERAIRIRAKVFWPNTVVMEFEDVLTPLARSAPSVLKTVADRTQKFVKKYIKN
jgi:hypothetical protein